MDQYFPVLDPAPLAGARHPRDVGICKQPENVKNLAHRFAALLRSTSLKQLAPIKSANMPGAAAQFPECSGLDDLAPRKHDDAVRAPRPCSAGGR